MAKKKLERLTLEQIKAATPGVSFAWIPGLPAYLIGDNGDVWSRVRSGPVGNRVKYHDTFHKLSHTKCSFGYPGVSLMINGRCLLKTVHSLVMLAFVGPRPEGMQVCHEDGDVTNCRKSNLRYDTPAGNQADRDRHDMNMRGERNGLAKLTESQVLEIRGLAASGLDQTAIGDQYGITQAAVSLINTRKTWKYL